MQFIMVLAIAAIHVAASAIWWSMGKDKLSMAAAVSIAFSLWLGGEIAERRTYSKVYNRKPYTYGDFIGEVMHTQNQKFMMIDAPMDEELRQSVYGQHANIIMMAAHYGGPDLSNHGVPADDPWGGWDKDDSFVVVDGELFKAPIDNCGANCPRCK